MLGISGLMAAAFIYFLVMWQSTKDSIWTPDGQPIAAELSAQVDKNTGEFNADFLANPDNLNTLPWVNETGKLQIFYCRDPEDKLRLYAWPGFCSDGAKRAPAGPAIQKQLYEQARQHQEERKKKAEAEELERTMRAEVDRLDKQISELKESLAFEYSQLRKEDEAAQSAVEQRLEVLQKRLDRSESLLQVLASRTAEDGPDKQPATVQPAVYTEPAPSSPPVPPYLKPKARLVVNEMAYFAEYNFRTLTFDVAEKNGVDVVFDRFTLSIWRRVHRAQPLEEVKRTKPIVFERNGFEWGVKGGASPIRKKVELKNYTDWLWNQDWVEIQFFGKDANGNPQQLLISGAS